jgi:hypothetical protein
MAWPLPLSVGFQQKRMSLTNYNKFGATRRSRTGDLLITNSGEAQNELEPADETPQKTED